MKKILFIFLSCLIAFSAYADQSNSSVQSPLSAKAFQALFDKLPQDGQVKTPEEISAVWFEKAFKQNQQEFHAVFIKSNIISGDIIDDCTGCEAKISVVTYKKSDNQWQLLSKQRHFTQIGMYGDPPDSANSEIQLTPEKFGLMIQGDYSRGGLGLIGFNLFVFSKENWADLGFIRTEENNDGACMDNEPESMPCTGYIGKISIVPGNKEYPDLFIAKFGTEPSVDRKKIPVKNSLYVFNGKEYEEQPTVITANSGSDSQMGQSFVWDMLQLSGIGNEQKILNIKNILQALPKPNKGNRKGAREINDHALSLIRQEQFSNAAQLLQQASQLDPSDMEIMNNLGFALLKTQQLTQAESVLIKILTYKPDRVSAWENLGHTFALKGTEDTETLALEAYLNSLLFSTDREKTVAYFAKQLEEENQPAVKSAISKAIMQAKRRYHIP